MKDCDRAEYSSMVRLVISPPSRHGFEGFVLRRGDEIMLVSV